MPELYERIKARREELGISQEELAKRLGYKSRSSVHKIEKGENDIPQSKIIAFAKALKTTPVDLMGWQPKAPRIAPKVEHLPSFEYDFLASSVYAGAMDEIIDPTIERITVPDEITGRYAGNKKLLFMRVNGDSMNNVFPHGSTIGVLRDYPLSSIKNGDIVVIAERGEHTVKRQYYDQKRNEYIFRPDSTDPTYRDIIYPYEDAGDLYLIGKVVIYNVVL